MSIFEFKKVKTNNFFINQMSFTMLPKLISLVIMITLFGITACSNSSSNKEQAASKQTQKPEKESSDEKNTGMAKIKDEESPSNILEIAGSSDAHTTLANPGPFTAFAPTDEAFNQLPDKTLNALMKPENKKKLSTILERHVAPVSYDKKELKQMAEKNQELFMANGDYLSIKNKNGKVMIKDANVVKSIKASNGVIHVVDKVILPKK